MDLPLPWSLIYCSQERIPVERTRMCRRARRLMTTVQPIRGRIVPEEVDRIKGAMIGITIILLRRYGIREQKGI